MQFNVDVLSVEKNKKGNYEELIVTYMRDGKAEVKKFVSFDKDTKDVYNILTSVTKGAKLIVETEKNAKGYWAWTAVKYLEVDSAPAGAPKETKNFPADPRETKEERELKQLYITRQWAVNGATALLKTDKTRPELTQVLQVAVELENWVYRQDDPVTILAKMKDDLPWETKTE